MEVCRKMGLGVVAVQKPLPKEQVLELEVLKIVTHAMPMPNCLVHP